MGFGILYRIRFFFEIQLIDDENFIFGLKEKNWEYISGEGL